MNKINELACKAKVALAVKMNSLLEKKSNGDSQLVVALVLIAVAVGLCIIFRNTINNIMTNLFATITNSINQLSAGSIS